MTDTDHGWEYGYENMDRGGEGPMMIGRPLEEIREIMRRQHEAFPEVHYALRRRRVSQWETVEEASRDD